VFSAVAALLAAAVPASLPSNSQEKPALKPMPLFNFPL